MKTSGYDDMYRFKLFGKTVLDIIAGQGETLISVSGLSWSSLCMFDMCIFFLISTVFLFMFTCRFCVVFCVLQF